MFQRDAANTGSAPGTAAVADGAEERWRFGAGGARPPVLQDGTVYFADRDANRLYAVDAENGDERWSREKIAPDDGSELPLALRGTVPAVAGDTLLLCGANGTHAFSPTDGALQWTRDEEFLPVPVVTDGTAYLVSNTDGIHARDVSDGRTLWTEETEGATCPLAVSDGSVISGLGREIVALDAETGDEIWTRSEGKRTDFYNLAVAGGTVYASAATEHDDDGYADGTLFAYDVTDGSRQWRYECGYRIPGSAAVGEDTVFVGGNVATYALNADDGEERWQFDVGTYGGEITSPSLLGDTLYFVGGENGTLFAVDAGTGDERWSLTTGRRRDGGPWNSVVTADTIFTVGRGGIVAYRAA